VIVLIYSLIPSRIWFFFHSKSFWSMEGTMPGGNIENERFSSSNIRKCHTTEVLLILNQFSTYSYGPHSQFINNKILVQNPFYVWKEQCQMQALKTNHSDHESIENYITRKLLSILNRLRSYSYDSYSQEEYSKFVIWNWFEWHK
jgi:hypothetical protein